MSLLPLEDSHFEAGRRVTPIDSSEGPGPLFSLFNSVGQVVEGTEVMAGAIDLSAATAAVIKTANRRLTTNSGANRVYTLPTFATAPEGWMHMFLQLSVHTLAITPDGADTINGVAAPLTPNAAHEWAWVFKIPGAASWTAISTTTAIVPV